MKEPSNRKILMKEIKKHGYHISTIEKGEIGKSTKILEEVLELIDAEKQECRVMALVELSDLFGAIQSYLNTNMKDISMKDLETMSNITKRAFENGFRK